MSQNRESPWNSLEVAKLLASLLTPLMVAVMGFVIQNSLNSQERAWKAQQRLADARLQIYDNIKDDLNRIYCFVEDVGTWKEETPDKIIGYKRSVDRVMYVEEAVWSPPTFRAYTEYMDAAFATFQGVGEDAKIKTTDDEKKIGIKGWNKQWSERLTHTVDPGHKAKYHALIDAISRDLMLEGHAGSK